MELINVIEIDKDKIKHHHYIDNSHNYRESIITKQYELTEEKDEEELNIEIINDPIMEIVTKTREKINKTILGHNSLFDKSIIKSMVSKKKYRFEHEGFDLDLSYINENIIAMGFPAVNLEKLYRNNMDDVKRFFEKRHDKHYKVYNLCSEKSYAENTFFQQAYYPFNDHEAPPIDMLIPFCKDVHEFLNSDIKNVVSIHCKAGKGRTGTMICIYLLYSGSFQTAEDTLKFYGYMRTKNGKGVTIPSQIRYVYYFEHLLKANIPHPLKITFTTLITKIKLFTVPKISIGNKCTPYFQIENEKSIFDFKKLNKLETYKNEGFIEMNANNFCVQGDVKFTFFNKNTIGKDKMFMFWINTYFLPNDGVLTIKKSMLDKAFKDKNNSLFENGFKIEIQYITLDQNYNVYDNNLRDDILNQFKGLKI